MKFKQIDILKAMLERNLKILYQIYDIFFLL